MAEQITDSTDERHAHSPRQRMVTRRAFLAVTAGGAMSLALVACSSSAPAPSTGAAKPAGTTPPAANNAPAATAAPAAGSSGGAAPAATQPAAAAQPAAAKPAASGKPSNVPTYIAAQGPKPDYPSSEKGNQAGYVNFPKELAKSVPETPAKGGDVTGMVLVGVTALPTPVDNNIAWQQLNKELGANLKLNMVPQPDYAAKWATVTAGSDLPDVMYVSIVPTLPNVPAFMKSACADLTPYLGGDAIKDYPNLANIPPASWRVSMLDGAVYGVPIPRPITGWPMYVQQNMLDAMGAKPPTTADEFKSLCKDLTKPDAGHWAMGVTNDSTTGPYSMLFFQGIFRAPNNWRLDAGGKLVKDIETDEYKAALTYLRDMVQSGYISPDVKSNADLNNDLFSGKVAMRGNAWNAYSGLYVEQAPALKINIRSIPPFGFDGKPGSNMMGPGNFGFAIIKKASADRVKELLRVLNYLAAPFGSQEYMVSKFGIKDKDYSINDKGSPVFTDLGKTDMPGSPNLPWGYIATAPTVIFSVNQPDFGHWGHDEEAKMIDVGVADPTYGTFSQTAATKGPVLDQLIFDRVSGMAAGRAPLSDLDQLVKDWRAQGGDAVRDELQKALAS